MWLTSPTGLPVLIAIIGVLGTLLGVLVSVLTQVVLQRSVDSRETERLAFERQRWQFEQDAMHKSRHEDLKREAYIGYLYTGVTLHGLFAFQNEHRLRFRLSKPTRTTYQRALDDWARRIVEIRILAPEVHAITFKTGDQVDLIYNKILKGHSVTFQLDELSDLLARCRRAMQHSLQIEPEDGIAKVPARYNWGLHGTPHGATFQHAHPVSLGSIVKRPRTREISAE